MIIANLNEMLGHKLGVEYEYLNHKWINEQLSCGCTSAICTDVEPSKEDRDYVTKLMTKVNTLQSLINETIKSTDEEIRKRFGEFQKEVEETRVLLKEFIIQKRKDFNFPNNVDFNSEYYLLKIKQGSDCKNN
jgi:hypothetical protein